MELYNFYSTNIATHYFLQKILLIIHIKNSPQFKRYFNFKIIIYYIKDKKYEKDYFISHTFLVLVNKFCKNILFLKDIFYILYLNKTAYVSYLNKYLSVL